MGVLQRMRSLSTVVIGGIIVVFLLFMVLQDNRINELVGSSGLTPSSVIGSIEGEDITNSEFTERINEMTEQMRQQNQQQGNAEQEIDVNMVREQVWNQLVEEKLVEHEAKKMGISVGKEELLDIMLDNPPEFLTRSFKDSNGTFMRQYYMEMVTNPDGLRDKIPDNSGIDKDAEVAKWKKQLIQIENALLKQKVQDNVRSAIGVANGAVSPTYVKTSFENENTVSDVQFVFVDAAKVSDKQVSVSDDEISAYYESHKEKYKQKDSRKIKYASFAIKPSSADSARSFKAMMNITSTLAMAADVNQKDSAFTNLISQYAGKSFDFQPSNAIDPRVMSVLSTLGEKQVSNPVPSQVGMTFYRLDAKRAGADTLVRASHILIGFGTNKDSALAEANRILGLARGGDFAALATQYSEDKGSAQKGGDLDFFGKGKMVPEFEKAAFAASVGSIVGPVESQFGYHIIKVTDKQNTDYKYSEVTVSNAISSATKKEILRNALSFKQQVENGANFDTLAKQNKVLSTETTFFQKSQPILSSFDITNFAFSEKKGAVSKPFELKYYGYVVAQITDARSEGLKPLADVKDDIKMVLMLRKKIDAVKAKAEQVQQACSQAGNLEAAKTIDTSLMVRTAMQMKGNGQVQGLGQDFAFTTAVMKAPIGKVSSAIRGEKGYYVAVVTNRAMPDNSKFGAESNAIVTRLSANAKNSAYFLWLQNKKDKADIEDNRSEVFYGSN